MTRILPTLLSESAERLKTADRDVGRYKKRTLWPIAFGLWPLFCLWPLFALSSCEPPANTQNNVVGVFGAIGLGDGMFSYPRAIAAIPGGGVYVVDKSARVQRFSDDGVFEFGWPMPAKQFGKPIGLTVHPDGRVFVADTHYSRVCIFSPEGHLLDSFGSPGDGDGQFRLPTDVAIDRDGSIFVSEYGGNDRISKWRPDLTFVEVITDDLYDGEVLQRPAGIDIDDEQTIWVADACNHRILRIDRNGELLACFGKMGDAPGELRYPYDITCGHDGSIMVCEYEGHRIQWFDRKGQSLATWGTPGRDIGQLWLPWGATYGANGRLFVVDSQNSRVQIVNQ
jgi:DNA-binding beta-propeller fold protein YncE